MNNKNKKHLGNYNILISMLACSSIIFLFWISFWWSNFSNQLVIKNIIISDTIILEDMQYLDSVTDLKDLPLNKIDLSLVAERLETHPYVRAARISYHFPNTILIEIVEREPIAIINTQPMVMIDEYGYILPNMNNITDFILPALSNFNPSPELYPSGKKVLSVKVKESIKWLNHLRNNYNFLYDDLSEIRLVLDSDIELILAEEPTKILLGNKNLFKKFEILKQFKIDLEPNKNLTDFSFLDMRYHNQIIAKDRQS